MGRICVTSALSTPYCVTLLTHRNERIAVTADSHKKVTQVGRFNIGGRKRRPRMLSRECCEIHNAMFAGGMRGVRGMLLSWKFVDSADGLEWNSFSESDAEWVWENLLDPSLVFD